VIRPQAFTRPWALTSPRGPAPVGFPGRVALNDVFSIGLLPIADVLAYAVFYTILLRSFGHPFWSGLLALISVEGFLVCASALVKKVLVGSTWGSDPSTSFWSWRHFTYFFAQDCFFRWCRRPLRVPLVTRFASQPSHARAASPRGADGISTGSCHFVPHTHLWRFVRRPSVAAPWLSPISSV